MAHTQALMEATRAGEPLFKAQTEIMKLMLGVKMALDEIERKEQRAFQEWFIAQDNKEIAFFVEMASYHLEILFDANMYRKGA